MHDLDVSCNFITCLMWIVFTIKQWALSCPLSNSNKYSLLSKTITELRNILDDHLTLFRW